MLINKVKKKNVEFMYIYWDFLSKAQLNILKYREGAPKMLMGAQMTLVTPLSIVKTFIPFSSSSKLLKKKKNENQFTLFIRVSIFILELRLSLQVFSGIGHEETRKLIRFFLLSYRQSMNKRTLIKKLNHMITHQHLMKP